MVLAALRLLDCQGRGDRARGHPPSVVCRDC
jgi:hypothetical protein